MSNFHDHFKSISKRILIVFILIAFAVVGLFHQLLNRFSSHRAVVHHIQK